MVCDAVANVVIRLQESGFDPHKVGPDSWESRCPAHRSAECARSITRNEHNHVVLECRSTQNLEETGDKRVRQSSVRVLTELASGARLFRSADGHFCAQVRVGDRLEIYGLSGRLGSATD
jgi:hypothetical protein